MNAPDGIDRAVRLTALSHGGGCGCKIAPGVLQKLLATSVPRLVPPELLVGIETADDAAVYLLNETQAIVATTDFFMPIVDDPRDFGRIAATNAISDIYAMGATPLFALSLVGMPVNVLPAQTIRTILEGGESICTEAGIPVAGGHTIDSVEPIYGLVVIGVVNPANLKRNSTAKAGDVLVLGKGLGVGVMSAALKKDQLDVDGYREMIASATKLNTPGIALGKIPAVHALTDVTGFGLAGHVLEVCRGANLGAALRFAEIPLLGNTMELVLQGHKTGASGRNWASYGENIRLGAGIDDAARDILTDPQTSGGLLVACDPQAAKEVLSIFAQGGFSQAAVIGDLTSITGEVHVI